MPWHPGHSGWHPKELTGYPWSIIWILVLVPFFISCGREKFPVIFISARQAINLSGRRPVIGVGALGQSAATGGTVAVEFDFQWIWIIFITNHKKMPLPCGLVKASGTPVNN